MARRKGDEFERETAALAGEYGKKTPKSGSYGTTLGVTIMAGDANWRFPWLKDVIVVECKHGYEDTKRKRKGAPKSMTIQRDWFDKHLAQAKALDFLPAWAMKFKFTSEDGMSKFVLIPFSTMREIIKQMENTYLELQELKEEKRGNNRSES